MSNAAGILDPLTPQDCDLRDFSFMPTARENLEKSNRIDVEAAHA